ncbi:MAG: glycosyltransferase [candidate division WOR-3 bacterium]
MYEIFLLNFVDSIIVASSVLGDEFKQKTNIPVSVIGNWHYPQQLDEYIVQDIRGRYIKNAKILITYIGSLDLSRALVPMIEAVKYQPDIQFLICGDGMQRKIVSELSAQIENVNYIGEIPLKMVPYFTAASDVIYYVLNEDSPIANYNAPNSLGFALITGKPMIASDMGDLGRVIRSTNCGILVKDSKVETLQEAILSLRQKNVRDELSRNALRAGKELYNWYHMEELLKKTYENIINV